MTTLKTLKKRLYSRLRSKQYASMFTICCFQLIVVFANFFYLQTESIQKPLEITSEKVLESILRWETIKSPKSSF